MYSKKQGGVSWIDLTVEDASKVRDFYTEVVGLEHQNISMGDYDDYVMTSSADEDAAVGICHAKGPNQDLPSQWLIYFNVEDVDQALQSCAKNGGKILRGKTDMGSFEMGVIRDPAGAVAGVIKSKPES